LSVPNTVRTAVVGVADISRAILVLRGHRVLLDEETKVLIQSVRRNRARFPPDFMFQLTASEWAGLRSQVVTSKRGGRRYAPHAFTEQGVAMLASVLGSDRAIAVNIQIMRAFVRMRELLISNRALADKLDQLEARLERKLTTHDAAIAGNSLCDPRS
jgi:hypothetical protein